MELGMIGLGRMGGNMAERLLRGGHRVVGYARRPEGLERIRRLNLGAEGVTTLPLLAEKLRPPRAVWLMIPAGEAVDR
ncbi:MAG: NAD(P)-binding domain-containing protein, partial [Armatimonadota bacterium]|nr:NAD(P)-binding domain-containing protein [Armatimonadota bacterium]